MKILIVGASSFIGFGIYSRLKTIKKYVITGTYFRNKKDDDFLFLDITDKDSIKDIMIEKKPDTVLWIAGSKNLKLCQDNMEYAKSVNVYPVKNAIDTIKEYGLNTKFIFFSSDYVFDGNNGKYRDSDIPKPNTNYGISKFEAENHITVSNLDYIVIRTSAVMGKGGIFFDWILKNLRDSEFIDLFENAFFTPTPLGLLVDNVENILNNQKWNKSTIHICGEKKFSRYEFGKYIKSLNNSFKAKINPSLNKLDIFQSDLSLVSSKCSIKRKSLDDYFLLEIG
jgi:dTDP-4-dehydrorhamnose reductase